MGDIEYTTWQLGGRPIGGMLAMGEEFPPELPSHWRAYFAVEDADATVERIKAAGGDVMYGPVDIPAGRFAVAGDPHRAVFGVIRL
jgi:predicted enzyme related to lactoylglutathione lyase